VTDVANSKPIYAQYVTFTITIEAFEKFNLHD